MNFIIHASKLQNNSGKILPYTNGTNIIFLSPEEARSFPLDEVL